MALGAGSPGDETLQTELGTLRAERDLYRRLLSLGSESQLEDLLREALALLIEVSSARLGYLEFQDPRDDQVRWTASGIPDDEVDRVQHTISHGIVAQALVSGETVTTHAARADPRFRDRGSVQSAGVEAVLCAPIGSDPVLGAVYLEKPAGEAVASFTGEDVERVELVATALRPNAERLLGGVRDASGRDPTLELRRKLECEGVVGRSEALAAVLHEVSLVAPLDVSVLIAGETGTGKSQIARVVHASSPRAQGAFVEVNCAALPAELIENELFGALPGAHSTAQIEIKGKVAAAEGGTLFLDEITEMPISSQAKLLQLLQTLEYFPLGAAEPRRANVRVLAASNVDLEQAVEEKRLRQDLYFRLQVVPLRIPALAERPEDVPLLARHFCSEHRRRHQLGHVELSSGAMHALEMTPWPGNVRQLSNLIEAGVIRADGEGVQQVEVRHLFPERSDAEAAEPVTLQDGTREFQRAFVRAALEACGWNVAQTARRLDVARPHLHKLIKSFGLERPKR